MPRTIDLSPLAALSSSYTWLMFIGRYYMILDFDKSWAVLEAEEPDDYVREINGRVVGLEGSAGRRRIAGRFKAFYMDVEAACTNDYPIFNVFDGAEQTLGYYSAIFDEEGSSVQFSERVFKLLDERPYSGNVLILDRLEILPKFRSHNLGLMVMRRLIELFRPGAEVVAIKPFPLQAEHTRSQESTWRAKLELAQFDKDSRRARAKLRRHYAKLGFKHMRGTEFMFLFAGDTLPRITDLEK